MGFIFGGTKQNYILSINNTPATDYTLISRKDERVTLIHNEYLCYRALLQGLSLKEIADRLDMSIKSVGYYISQCKYKLKCHSRSELFSLGFRNHIIYFEK